jgi:hypothetical protein
MNCKPEMITSIPLILRFGSTVPGRSACGFFRQ